jgi:cytochrome P450
VALFYLISVPETLRKLKMELKEAIQDPSAIIPLASLEQLPYLTACIQESLRLSYGVSTRLQRVSPDEVLLFNDGQKDWEIPPGTPVSMTSTLVHQDPAVFPEPLSFKPERWLDNPRLDKYMLSFSKGTRQCIGINLAYAELYMAFSTIFRSYGSPDVKMKDDLGYFELFETTLEDVEIMGDGVTPLTKPNTKGIRIHVRK